MQKLISAALILLLATPSSALAWGAVGHRFITEKAIEILPAEIKPFFVANRDELMLRSNDPDLYRVVGFEDEPPNHQIDLGVADYGAFPFVTLPREYEAAIEKFGLSTLRQHGTLPWRTTEQFGNLTRTMRGFSRNQLYVAGNTVLFAAVLAHYIEDATEPFHVTNDYNGQSTGQIGIHSRFESELIERFRSQLKLEPPPIAPVTNASAFIWEIILDANPLVPKILEAEKAAIAGKDTYDDEFFERFFANIRPVLERQLSRAISATASAYAGAWQQAGRPMLRPDVPRPVEKVRPAR